MDELMKLLSEPTTEQEELIEQAYARARHSDTPWPTQEEVDYYDALYAEPDTFFDDALDTKEDVEVDLSLLGDASDIDKY